LAAEISIVPATLDHAAHMAPRMRIADCVEVWASDRLLPLQALRTSLRRTPKAWAGLVDGRPECIFGVSPLAVLGECGVPWMLGSEDLPDYAVPFLRRNRAYIASIIQDYRELSNYVDARNSMSIRWLKWLGFAIMPTETYGPFGLPFHKFVMTRDDTPLGPFGP